MDTEGSDALRRYTEELESLSQSIKASDVDNIKNITFIEKGREILVDLNSSLKIVKVLDGFNNSNVSIENLNINGSKLIVKNVGPVFENSASAVYSDKDVKYNIKENPKTQIYDVFINRNNLELTIIYSNDKILSKINYTKENFIPNINSIIINTEMEYKDGEVNVTSNNSLTGEQELLDRKSVV